MTASIIQDACQKIAARVLRAVQRKDAADLAQLLEAGVDPDACDSIGTSALAYAVTSHSLDTAEMLLRHGADIHHTNRFGMTALLCAAMTSNINMMRLLIDRKADVNVQENEMRVTALHYAADKASLEMTEILLNAGANPLLADKDGLTPLAVAKTLIPPPEQLIQLLEKAEKEKRALVEDSVAGRQQSTQSLTKVKSISFRI